tara:strand:+ start:1804 stop:2370 length:567 start_codon:yes stop_codon:yes gene_type:complete
MTELKLTQKLGELYPSIQNELPQLSKSVQLCYDFNRIMSLRDLLIKNYNIQKVRNNKIMKDDSYKKYLFLGKNENSRLNSEYSILSHEIYKIICSTVSSQSIQNGFYESTYYEDPKFLSLLNNVNYNISLPIINYSVKPYIAPEDILLMKSWTKLLNKFMLKIISLGVSDQNLKELKKVQKKIGTLLY